MLSARRCAPPTLKHDKQRKGEKTSECRFFFGLFATSVSLYSVYNINMLFVIAAGELGREGHQKLQV